jgi:hypothetical protein
MESIAIVLTAAVLTMMVPGFLRYRSFVESLRSRHPETWESIGRPTLLFYGSLDGSRRVHRFVRQRGYTSLDDAELTRVCDRYRWFVRAYSMVCVAAAVTLTLTAIGVGT